METILKQIEGSNYFVNDRGNVYHRLYSNHTPKDYVKLTPTLNRFGYECITIYYNNGREKKIKRYWQMHRLVYTIFKGEIQKGMIINHKNFDRCDNHISNLEVVSYKQNTDHYKASKGFVAYHTIASKNGVEIICNTHRELQLALGFKYRANAIIIIRDGNYDGWTVTKVEHNSYKDE